MTEEKFIHTNLKNELTHDFLVEILKHYHYEQKDMEMLKEEVKLFPHLNVLP